MQYKSRKVEKQTAFDDLSHTYYSFKYPKKYISLNVDKIFTYLICSFDFTFLSSLTVNKNLFKNFHLWLKKKKDVIDCLRRSEVGDVARPAGHFPPAHSGGGNRLRRTRLWFRYTKGHFRTLKFGSGIPKIGILRSRLEQNGVETERNGCFQSRFFPNSDFFPSPDFVYLFYWWNLYAEGLECGTCKELNEFGLKEIEADCLKCCRKSEEEATTYQVCHRISVQKWPCPIKSGVLEVCSWKIGRFPQVAAFIEEKSKQLKNFKVEYVRGAPPRIKLYGKFNINRDRTI